MYFKLLDDVRNIEQLNFENNKVEYDRIKKLYKYDSFRKLKGKVELALENGNIVIAEIHWYELSIAKTNEIKIKKILK